MSTFNHEFLWLNNKRQYLLLENDTWYDSNANYTYEENDIFLGRKIKRILDYDKYVEEFPEVSNIEQKYKSTFINGIFLRTYNGNQVLYNYDNTRQHLGTNKEEDIRD